MCDAASGNASGLKAVVGELDGEIDVLVRNTTWTASRDGGEGATFLTPTFYDGQGIMVGTDSGFTAITAIVSSEMISMDMRPRAKATNIATVTAIAAIA